MKISPSIIRLFLFVAAMVSSASAFSQVKIDTTISPQNIIEKIFLGKDIRIGNVKFQGSRLGIGVFHTDSSFFGMSEGFMLTTGHILNATGPNEDEQIGGAFTNKDQKVDKDLNRLAGAATFDVVAIEFDFIPLHNKVTFRFCFASEEFKEFVGLRATDAFGFFLKGGGQKQQNLAVIPKTNIPVNINSINFGAHTDLYIDNEPMRKKRPKGKALVNEFEYDGFTKTMQALCFLVPYEKYHIKIVIGDVNDKALDSAVLLEAGSFSSTKDSTATSYVAYDVERDFNYDSAFAAKPQVKTPKPTITPPLSQVSPVIIAFNNTTYSLPDSSKSRLNETIQFLLTNKTQKCHIISNNGNASETIQTITDKKATLVVNYLTSKGIEKSRLIYRGNKTEATQPVWHVKVSLTP